MLPVDSVESLDDSARRRRLEVSGTAAELNRFARLLPHRGVFRIPCLARFETSSELLEPVHVHAMSLAIRDLTRWGDQIVSGSRDECRGSRVEPSRLSMRVLSNVSRSVAGG